MDANCEQTLLGTGLTARGEMKTDYSSMQTSLILTLGTRELLRHSANQVSDVIRECIRDEVRRVIREDAEVRSKVASAVEIATKELPLDIIVKAVKEAVLSLEVK